MISGFVLLVRALLVTLLLLAVAPKLPLGPAGRTRWRAFARSLRTVPGLGTRASAPVALAVTLAEVASCLLLLVAPLPGLALATLLLGTLTAGVLGIVATGSRVTCHCFGAGAEDIGAGTVLRNVLLTVLAGAALVTGPHAAAVAPAPAVLLVATGALAGIAVAFAAELRFLLVAPTV
ncbi:MAG: hypothetical protein JWO76_1952 [Nocardioides sp.]|nr:hypothetical protein [Nocardioides sp.]